MWLPNRLALSKELGEVALWSLILLLPGHSVGSCEGELSHGDLILQPQSQKYGAKTVKTVKLI